MRNSYFWTSECVGPGHPDKIADQISDAVLDECLMRDTDAKVACETLVKDNIVILAGEITLAKHAAITSLEKVVRNTIYRIGYTDSSIGFSHDNFKFINLLSNQSSEINTAVTTDGGAGDQGIMFGYATNETPTYMPLTMYLSRKLVETMEEIRQKEGAFTYPDCKTQFTVEYDNESKKPLHVSHVVLSVHHKQGIRLKRLRETLMGVIETTFMEKLPHFIKALFDKNTKYIINHAGEWNIGGPVADSGLTGRKIVVDAYGADCEVGGGAFSGKDPSKVDRSAAYMARYIAKNIVAADLASKAKVQISYVIGNKDPISFRVDTLGTGRIPDQKIEKRILELVSLRPSDIIKHLNLKNPIYFKTANLGHFGNTEFSWENLDLIYELKL